MTWGWREWKGRIHRVWCWCDVIVWGRRRSEGQSSNLAWSTGGSVVHQNGAQRERIDYRNKIICSAVDIGNLSILSTFTWTCPVSSWVCSLMPRKEKIDLLVISIELIRWRHGRGKKGDLGCIGEGHHTRDTQKQRDGGGSQIWVWNQRRGVFWKNNLRIILSVNFTFQVFKINICLVIFIFKEGTCDGSAWMKHIKSSVKLNGYCS